MRKFRKYDSQLAKAETDADFDKSKTRWPSMHVVLANAFLLSMERDVKLGLMDCYESWEDSMRDRWLRFPQSKSVTVYLAIKWIREDFNDYRLNWLATRIKEDWDFDLLSELDIASAKADIPAGNQTRIKRSMNNEEILD